ncbi:CDP-glycerol glycerophosphotransferase family protein [Porcipelethomonas sp.]|uniref:CDP-glycerol glycerophosphotransferase family protein n=1 Tax=Porcipelethomonas sp. TaxID=2981675 RepID=UPI003EF82E2B
MALKKNLNKILNKLKTRIWFSIYYGKYLKTNLKNNLVFIESRNGTDLAGNILYITKELYENPDYSHLKLCISAKPFKTDDVKAMLRQYGIKKIKFVRAESLKYYKYLTRAKYLVNDTSFPRRFIKKDGQIILNTWHGTPLKNMGRDVENEVYNMGNVMRNLVFSDFLVFPNEYMKEKMVSAYMLKNLSKATILNEGYPRNSVFFNTKRRKELRQEFGIDGKQIIVYMPTWRGKVNSFDTERVIHETTRFLEDMDSRLSDSQLMYVKYHPLMKLKFEDDEYKHILSFPTGYEYYEILNMADTLITDYSSVFYDFANSRQKIILYTYDKEEYFRDRGVYVSLDEFPFPQTTNVDELIEAINAPKDYDDTEFIKKYCTYDNPDAVKKICQRVFLDKPVTNEEKLIPNGKKNILIYAGDLNKNGITTALISVLENIDLNRYNYYISFRERNLRADPTRTTILPKEVGVIPISSEMFFDFKSAFAYNKFTKHGKETGKIKKVLAQAYAREIRRHFYGIKFDHVIHYNGYENNIQGMLTQFDARKTIFVHNDMVQEIETKHNQNFYLLKWAYNVCDNVVAVSEDIVESTYQISGRRDNIRIISNFHNHDSVVIKGDMPLEFQKETEIFCPNPDGINHLLNSPGMKFITIGRFSPEKGHFRLIDAFEAFHKNYPEAKLIIIGGLGKLYGKTVQKVRKTDCWENIALIKSMKNPMPILKRCDLFILSSIYEGLGLVMLEADSLGVPVFSTDVHGPSKFLKENGGYLVEDSTEGILQGMYDFADGKIKPMNIDYISRNATIREQLEEIL